MTMFYCNGKKGTCEHGDGWEIHCPRDCPYFDDTGGYYVDTEGGNADDGHTKPEDENS